MRDLRSKINRAMVRFRLRKLSRSKIWHEICEEMCRIECKGLLANDSHEQPFREVCISKSPDQIC